MSSNTDHIETLHAQAHDIVFFSGEDGEGYDSTVDFLEDDNVSDAIKLAYLVGKYNYQVENGGHHQYFDNGYAGGTFGCFAPTDEKASMTAHKKMIDLLTNEPSLEPYRNEEPATIHQVIDIAERFLENFEIVEEDEFDYEVCFACGGDGEWYEDDEAEENEDLTVCDDCDGTGEVEEEVAHAGDLSSTTTFQWEQLDDEYYQINQHFLVVLDRWANKFVEK